MGHPSGCRSGRRIRRLYKFRRVPYPQGWIKDSLMRFGLIITAVVVYLAVLGCVIFPARLAGEPPNGSDARPFRAVNTGAPLTGLPYRGIAMLLERTDWTDE